MLSNELGDIIEKKEAVIKQLTNTEEISKDDDDFENVGDLTGICIIVLIHFKEPGQNLVIKKYYFL